MPWKEALLIAEGHSSDRYALSFTSGGLLVREATLLTPIYLEQQQWAKVRQISAEKNLLQARTAATGARVTRETIQRLSVFDDEELRLVVDSSLSELCHLMWVAACRRYKFIGDFAEEVVRERFLLLTPTLESEDFDRFLTGKSMWHPELDELKRSTLAKLRQNLFRMLHEAGLLDKEGSIVPAVLSERVRDLLSVRVPNDIRFLPTNLPIEVSA